MQTSNRLLPPANHGPDYDRILGSGGSVELARQRFIAAGFSPRKPLLFNAPRFHALAIPDPAPQGIPIDFGRARTLLRLAA